MTQRRYPVEPTGGTTPSPPNYRRVAESLSEEAIRDELDQQRGSDEYRKALTAELRRRARQGK